MNLPDPGSFQRRHRIIVLASVLSAMCLLPVWPAAAAGFLAQAAVFYVFLPESPGRGLPFTSLALFLLGLSLLLAPPSQASFPVLLPVACLLTLLAIGACVRHHLSAPHFPIRAVSVVGLVLPLAVFTLMHWQVVGQATLPWVAALPGLIGVNAALIERLRWRWLATTRRRQASLSVIVVCKNEADRIDECLRRVAAWADEIVVFDSGSEDETVSIVRRYTDRIWETDWQGYSRQKQRALEECRMDWVLSLDADEYVTEELKREIDARLNGGPDAVAFRIPWVSHVFGGFVFFGADGRYHKRLFRREHARFNRADVHEDVEVEGSIATLSGPVLHHTFRDYAHLRQKFTQYALLSAAAIARRRRGVSMPEAFLRAVVAFLLLYFRRMGFADGRRGLLMAMAYASYTFDKYAAAWTFQIGSPGPASGSDLGTGRDG